MIRNYYKDRTLSQKEVYQMFKDKISFTSFQNVWQGRSWPNIMPEIYNEENKMYYVKQARTKTSRRFTDKEIIDIRSQYETKTAKEIYKNYSDRCTYSTFQVILCGEAYKHLPYYHKKTKKWIYPGDSPSKNSSRVKANQRRMTTNVYTEQEVMEFRKMYVTKTCQEIYDLSNKLLSMDSFRKMLSGKTYQYLPYYSKKQKQWINKAVSTISESAE